MSNLDTKLLELEASEYFKLKEQQSSIKCCKMSSQPGKYLYEPTNNRNNFTPITLPKHPCSTPKHSEARMFSKNLPQVRINRSHQHCHSFADELATYEADIRSPTLSTNSLPSISSSPSISPSLMCPHLTIDDILKTSSDKQTDQVNVQRVKSPHTVGLCAKCFKSPPPTIQSPLSPIFNPSRKNCNRIPYESFDYSLQLTDEYMKKNRSKSIKRYNEDNYLSPKQFLSQTELKPNRIMQSMNVRKVPAEVDSLDFCLSPNELERSRLSPVIKQSIDFLQKNQYEAARILLIHKNGFPFDNPIRVNINRDEFCNLDKLLDFINTREVIAGGARYLFHLDGQLVYSVNELKHGSVYIVSGSRTLQSTAISILRERYHDPKNKPLKPRYYDLKPLILPSLPKVRLNKTSLPSSPEKTAYKRKLSSENQLPMRRTKSCLVDVKRKTAQPSAVKRSENLPISTSRSIQANFPNTKNDNLIKKTSLKQKGRTKSDLVRSDSIIERQAPKKGLRKSVTFHVDSPSKTEDLKNNEDIKVEVKEIPLPPKCERAIQVSESLEGYLIDLPVSTKETKLSKSLLKDTNSKNIVKTKQNLTNSEKTLSKPRRKFIVEKQLSSQELNVFKDMHQGDHHRANKITSTNKQQSNQHNNRDKVDEASLDEGWEVASSPADENGQSSVEKTVNQSVASDMVRKKNTPSSPSINSSSADNTSLVMSDDNGSFVIPIHRKQSMMIQLSSILERDNTVEQVSNQAQTNPVCGRLGEGKDVPDKCMELSWANGFFINDKFPQNTSSITKASVSPQNKPNISNFKPYSRYHNFAKHSNKYDELIYPLGTLIVLYSPWTNLQRYYSGHTADISALALVEKTTDNNPLDFVLSSQIGDKLIPQSCVHLWSVKTLETVLVVSDNIFESIEIFSICSTFDNSESGMIAMAGRHALTKDLWILSTKVNCSTEFNSIKDSEQNKVTNILTFSKPVAENQEPLVIFEITKISRKQLFETEAIDGENLDSPNLDFEFPESNRIVMTLGQRHFHIWLLDFENNKISQLKGYSNPKTKFSTFPTKISRATCIKRLNSNRFLLGDSDGCITLMWLQVCQVKQSMIKTLFGTNDSAQTITFSLKETMLVAPKTDKPKTKKGLLLRAMRGLEPDVAPITCLGIITEKLVTSGDSDGTVKFWSLTYKDDITKREIEKFNLLSAVKFPVELMSTCTIIMSNYSKKEYVATFYVMSTSNSIHFGSFQILLGETGEKETVTQHQPMFRTIQEGHGTHATNLAVDTQIKPNISKTTKNKSTNNTKDNESQLVYFTCAVDCKVCKWEGKTLLWESILPSACVSLSIYPNGGILAAGSVDGTVYIVDKNSGLLASYFSLTPVRIDCLSYSKDGNLLAAGCSNNSIFILPVQNKGLAYKKVSIFQSPSPVLSLQFSIDNQFILTCVDNENFSGYELILWDIPNFRYMRSSVAFEASKIHWFDPVCLGTEDVRAISQSIENSKEMITDKGKSEELARNLFCHRFRQSKMDFKNGDGYTITGDTNGFVKLFRYPCSNLDQGFYEFRQTSQAIKCGKFLGVCEDCVNFASVGADNSIFLWKLADANK